MVFLDFEGRFHGVSHERALVLGYALLSVFHGIELMGSSYA